MTDPLRDFKRLAGLTDPRTLVTEAEADAWTVRYKRLSVSKDLKPEDVARIVAEMTGQDLKATLKKARQLGRDFQRVWESPNGRAAHSSNDAQFVALMQPFRDAHALLKHPKDDLSHAAVQKFEASLKAESKISAAWHSGFTEMEKKYAAAARKRELEIMHAAPPGVFHKHDKLHGYWGVEGVEKRLATETDPEVREKLQKMIDLMKAPLDY